MPASLIGVGLDQHHEFHRTSLRDLGSGLSCGPFHRWNPRLYLHVERDVAESTRPKHFSVLDASRVVQCYVGRPATRHVAPNPLTDVTAPADLDTSASASAAAAAESTVRPVDRRRTAVGGGVEDRLADDARQHHRRAAGHRRPRDGRPHRRLHRQRRDRRVVADLHHRHRVHHVAVHRDERARRALCRRRRRREGRSHRLSGVSDGDRDLAVRHGADRDTCCRRICSIS